MKTLFDGPLAEPSTSTYRTHSSFSFYRPHSRVTAPTGEYIVPGTGEVIPAPPSRTKQEFKDQCDINNIIKSFKLTGQINHVAANAAKGRYENLPDEVDFQTSLNTIRTASMAFESLPSKLRDRFGNDPTAFLEFISDPENLDEATRLGLIKKPEPAPVATAGSGGTPPPPAPPVATATPAPEPPKS